MPKNPVPIPLSDLRPGDEARVAGIAGRADIRMRLLEMGFAKGAKVRVEKYAPLGDPVELTVKGYHISLRHEECRCILVEKVKKRATADDAEGTPAQGRPLPPLGVEDQALRLEGGPRVRILVAGNPNCGKTTIFNALTGSRNHVGNYPGVTVETRSARVALGGAEAEILDLPGTYSLSARSEDERIASEELSRRDVGMVINVLDASNLERNLYLTTHLLELSRPMVFALNMMDDAEKSGKQIDIDKLQTLLGGPVVPLVGSRQTGIQELRDAISLMIALGGGRRHIPINYGDDIEGELQKLEKEIKQDERLAERIVPRLLALGLLERDPRALQLAADSHASRAIETQRAASSDFLQQHLGEDPAFLLAERRSGFTRGLFLEAVRTTGGQGQSATDKLDSAMTHRWLGIPILIMVMMAMYALTFMLGKLPQDWLTLAFDGLQGWAATKLPHGELASLLVDGVIPGVGAVAVFLPVIMILMGCISFLEDTGYMARAAFIMDRPMHMMGLHGKSFIPLLMGTGCNVPAIQAARTIEAGDDRLITILVSPLISCSARLQVYILLAGAFFAPMHAAAAVIALHFLGFGTTMLVGKLLRWTLFRGATTPFVMELPPYRMPVFRSTLIHMWEKGRTFLTRAGTSILLGSVLIWFFSHYPGASDRAMGSNYGQKRHEVMALGLAPQEEARALERVEAAHRGEILNTSYAASVGKTLQPVFKPIFDPDGARPDAWKDGVALMAGLVAKEVVVSTTAVMYRIPAPGVEDANDSSLRAALRGTSGMTPLTAFAFLVFVLLYAPCLATLSMIHKETRSLLWPAFTLAYGFVLAWGMSWLVVTMGRLAGVGL